MDSLVVFAYQNQSVRTFQDEQGNAWFCLKDILTNLKTTTTTAQAQTLLEEGFGASQVIVIPLETPGGKQNITFISEAGTTFLISRSRTEIGKRLNRWLHTEVLPSIRKTGSYSIAPQPKPQELSRLEILKMALEAEEKAIALQAQIEADKPATELGKLVGKSENNIRIGDFAKSIGMGQNRYFEELRDCGIIMSTGTLPYQRFLDNGYFVVTQVVHNNKTFPVALVTPKGQQYLAKRHRQYLDAQQTEQQIENSLLFALV